MDIEELINLLETKKEKICSDYPTGLTNYIEGKIDGLNIAIREIRTLYNDSVKTSKEILNCHEKLYNQESKDINNAINTIENMKKIDLK